MVKNRSQIHNKITEAHWTCNECGQDRIIHMNYGDKLTPPKKPCLLCGRQAGYKLNDKTSKFKDIQLVIIQEPLNQVEGGFQPAEVKVYFEDEMCDLVRPGNTVRINGVLELHHKGTDNMFTEYVTAEYVEQLQQDFEDITITPEDEEKIKEIAHKNNLFKIIKDSTLPNVYGHDELKEAVALYLFSSDNIEASEDTDYERGDIHILIVGDPGVAKSQILKRVARLAPRGIYTSGTGSTGAGLTATATKDEFGSWSLEAGAMALADKGNVCIDEFEKMRKEDRDAILEALEQQTITINKAGINAELNSRCSVLAAANPKHGTFNKMKSLKEQLTLSSPILSRFDFIFLLLDDVDSQRDKDIARSILMKQFDTDEKIPFELYRKYISYARKNVHPVLTEEVVDRISEFYTGWRETAKINNNPIPITPRQVQGMNRLAKASARARLSPIVELEDAERAIMLQEYCMKETGFDIETGSTNAAMVMGYNEGSKEEMNEERMNQLVDELFDEWGNQLSFNVLQRTFREKGLSKDAITKWLRNLDEQGKYFYEPSEGVLTKL